MHLCLFFFLIYILIFLVILIFFRLKILLVR